MSKYPCNIKFYKVYDDQEPDIIYIGSTKTTLNKRFSRHKNKNNGCSSRQILNKYPNAKIELIWEGLCNTKLERNEIENSYMKCFDSINKIKQSQVLTPWGDNPTQYYKEYREENREHYKEQKAKYYLNNKDYLDNKNKQYYNENKNKIKLIQSERIICECGKEIARGKKARHIKTLQHITNIKVIDFL